MRSLLAILLLAVVSAEAHAELPPLRCEHDWWVPKDDVPIQLVEVPSQPRLFLPAQIPWVNDGETSRLLEGLSVEVRDASGAEVAGQLDWAVYEDRLYTLSGVLRWRPNAELAPGERYTLTLAVMDAPADWEPYGCARRPGFSRTMVFTTASAPQETPRLDVSLQLARTWSTGIQHGPCNGWESDASCRNDSGYCCKAHHGAMWTYLLTVRLEGVLPPPLYTVVRAVTDWPGEWDRLEVIHPASGLRELSIEHYEPFVEPSSTGELCTVVSVHSLMGNDEVELANARICPEPDDISYLPHPGPLSECDPQYCGELEPGPEITADPDSDRSGGGCAGGRGGLDVLWVGAAIGAVRRRWGRLLSRRINARGFGRRGEWTQAGRRARGHEGLWTSLELDRRDGAMEGARGTAPRRALHPRGGRPGFAGVVELHPMSRPCRLHEGRDLRCRRDPARVIATRGLEVTDPEWDSSPSECGGRGVWSGLSIMGALAVVRLLGRGGMLMRRLIVALLLVAVAPTVRAESPPPNCNRDWWEPHDDVPTQLMEVPSAPLLLLPARVLWGHDGSLLAGVSVDVRDAAGGEVAGRLDRAFYEFELETLNGILRWQPNAALVPGERYTLELTVADAPQDWEPYGCVMRKGFSRSMVFMVAAAPREPPTLGVSLQAVRSWYTQTQHGLCDQMVPQASCGNGSDYCCRVLHQPTWSFQSRIELEGALPPPIYTAVRVRVVWPDGTQWHFALHPVNDGGELTVENSATFVELSGDEAFCTTVTAHDLMDVGAVELASTRTCLGKAEVIYTSEPGPLVQCDAEECAWFEAPPEPVEPGPEPVEPVEPGPEPVEPGPEAVELDEVEGPELTADPEWDRSGGGCAGGPSSWPAWAALGLARVIIGGEGRRVVRRPARRDL